MNTAAARKPLLPSDMDPTQALIRSCWAAASAVPLHANSADHVARLWPNDPIAHAILTRGAVSGALTSVPAWAGALANRAVSQWLPTLAPASAAAALIGRGITIALTDVVPLAIPVRANAPTAVGWVDEGGNIPVRSWQFSTVELNPAKMAVIVVLSKDLARTANALPIFEAMLREEAALSLDVAYFSTDDGSVAGSHAGLLGGLIAGTGSDDMAEDLAALAAIVGAGGSGSVVYVTGPGRAAAASIRMPAEASATVLPSLAVPEDRVVAVDPLSLVHGFGAEPEIFASEEVTLHMSDSPTNVSAPGAPPTVAAPTQSMYQTSQIALRLLLDIAFVARRPAVAYLDGCTW